MKTLLTTVITLFTFLIFSQQQLEFNQVKLVIASETVPTDKVWKLVSVIYDVPHNTTPYSTSTSSGCFSSRHQNYSVTINGSSTKVGKGSVPASGGNSSASTWSQHFTSLPLWLPEGATLDGGPCNNQISVIEFNIQ